METGLIDLDSRKMAGKKALEANQIEQAIQVYAAVLRDFPGDVESYLVLGDCYLADGDGETALAFYRQGLDYDPENPDIQRRIELAEMEVAAESSQIFPSGINERSPEIALPTNPKAIASILQEITCQAAPISEQEVLQAAKLLEEIVHSPHPAQAVAEHLDEINELIPALLELNIRQARLDGRQDLVDGLTHLLDNIQMQVEHKAAPKLSKLPQGSPPRKAVSELRILLVNPLQDRPDFRLSLLSEALHEQGIRYESYVPQADFDITNCDLIIASNPHVDPACMELLAVAHAAKKPIMLHLDVDVEQMPVSYADYHVIGLDCPSKARAYSAALILADLICVPSEPFANTLRQLGYPVEVIPPAWKAGNDGWTKPTNVRYSLNIGWIGFPGELEDVFQVRRMLLRVLREFPHVRLVIGGDPEVYQLFDSLPESRRIFIPAASQEEANYILQQVDILIIPSRTTPFSRSQSDRRLLEAGARGIPWVASPLPAYVSWGIGGLIANTPDEWHTYLRQLVLDTDLRTTLGLAGKQQAELRTSRLYAKNWYQLILRMNRG